MTDPYDLVVIGGGAAGFFSAITFAEKCVEYGIECRTLILEKSGKLLGKVKVSGGGRCNVTHACFDPKELAKFYPRGHKSLIGPFHRFNAKDTVEWFSSRGLELKTEKDGRMFPVTNSSQTVIDCLTGAARQAGVEVKTSTGVKSVSREGELFKLTTEKADMIHAKAVVIATGGTRLAAGAKLAVSLGHELIPNVPSLFAFNIDDARISDLPGLSVQNAEISVVNGKLSSNGPLLVTHHGLSGPGILKLSAWGARVLSEKNYQFQIKVNWVPGSDVRARLSQVRVEWGKRLVKGRSPFESLPKRFWEKACATACVSDEDRWSYLGKESTQILINELTEVVYDVTGKSVNKDEFVTCGGVHLHDVNLKTMESKIQPDLYFTGEVLDVDGVTGGFNFQNAWTGGYLAGEAIVNKHLAC